MTMVLSEMSKLNEGVTWTMFPFFWEALKCVQKTFLSDLLNLFFVNCVPPTVTKPRHIRVYRQIFLSLRTSCSPRSIYSTNMSSKSLLLFVFAACFVMNATATYHRRSKTFYGIIKHTSCTNLYARKVQNCFTSNPSPPKCPRYSLRFSRPTEAQLRCVSSTFRKILRCQRRRYFVIFKHRVTYKQIDMPSTAVRQSSRCDRALEACQRSCYRSGSYIVACNCACWDASTRCR